MKKYTITKNKRELYGIVFHQIRAARDIARNGVQKGDLGGWVQKKENLDQAGDAWVSGTARVSGAARVFGAAQVSGDAQVFGDARVFGDAQVSGDAWNKSPPYVQGSRHAVTACSRTEIAVGCERHPAAEWLARYEEIWCRHGYTPEEIEEYGRHLRYVAEWMARLPAVEAPPEETTDAGA